METFEKLSNTDNLHIYNSIMNYGIDGDILASYQYWLILAIKAILHQSNIIITLIICLAAKQTLA